jgi:hypothetical protein
MSIKTLVIWTEAPDTNTAEDLIGKIDTMITQGKTTSSDFSRTTVDGKSHAERIWIDQASAQEWIDFVKSYPGVESATIVTEA